MFYVLVKDITPSVGWLLSIYFLDFQNYEEFDFSYIFLDFEGKC